MATSDEGRTESAEQDYSGLSASQADLFKTVDAAIASLDKTVAALKDEIARLEAVNSDKLAEIDQLVASIASRKHEIEVNEQQKRNVGIIACMFGYCQVGAAALAMAINDDARIKQLNGELATAQADQANAKAALDRYLEKKEHVEEVETALVDHANKLRKIYQGKGGIPTGTGSKLFAKKPETPAIAQRRNAARDLQANLESQVENLTDLLDAAAQLSDVLDVAVTKTQTALDKVATLKKQSDDEFFKLIEFVTADDPNAAAASWLDDAITAKTQDAMRALGWKGWDPSYFVDHLIQTRFHGTPKAAKTLASQLIAALQFS